MRQLQFVGVSDDGAHLLLQDAANVREQFLLPVDDRLRAASRGDRSRLGQIELELDSTLRPREIQARIRAGESPEEVAAAANAPLQRVMRFAYPVLQEREQVTVEARRTRIRRSDGALQLGEQVDDRLTRQGIDPDTAEWDACRREDGTWWLSLSWMTGKTPRRAQWSFDLAGRTLTPADDLAAELQAEQPRRRQIAAVPFVPAEEPEDADDEPAAIPPRPHTVTQQPSSTQHPSTTQQPNTTQQPSSTQQPSTTQRNRPAQATPPAREERDDTKRGRPQRGSARPARTPDQPTGRTRGDQPATARPRSEPYGWAAPTEPAKSAEPTRSAEPTKSAKSAETAEPTERTAPAQPAPKANPIAAARPAAGTRPAADAKPTVPEVRPAQSAAANDRARADRPTPTPAGPRDPHPVVDAEPSAGETITAQKSAANSSSAEQPDEPETPAKPGKGRKPKVPSWDDIVFGTRGHR